MNVQFDKEKSHDVAWSSTARDFSISWDNIAREAGLDSEELECQKTASWYAP